VRDWLNKAENDLLAGRRILEGGMPASYDTVNIHARQAVEKALRTLLVRHQAVPREGAAALDGRASEAGQGG